MNRRTVRVIGLLAITLSLPGGSSRSTAQDPGDQQNELIVAKRGEVATGVVQLENEKELRLKTEPCHPRTAVVVFTPPYSKAKIGTVTCGSAVLDRYQVEKK